MGRRRHFFVVQSDYCWRWTRLIFFGTAACLVGYTQVLPEHLLTSWRLWACRSFWSYQTSKLTASVTNTGFSGRATEMEREMRPQNIKETSESGDLVADNVVSSANKA